MNIDFTLNTYKWLIESLQSQGFSFQTFANFLLNPDKKVVIMRHDVDLMPENARRMAKIEFEYGINASYYFRSIPESLNLGVVKNISDLGHEIGYHYEDLSLTKGNIEKAFDSFNTNLKRLREYALVKTICMHGSPISKWDSRVIWDKYDYKSLGLIGEPYFDLDFKEVLYLTDTGRRWDSDKVSIRDKPRFNSNDNLGVQRLKNTPQLIKYINQGKLPAKVMINVHPQRWTSEPIPWIKELIMQNIKNIVKYGVNKIRK